MKKGNGLQSRFTVCLPASESRGKEHPYKIKPCIFTNTVRQRGTEVACDPLWDILSSLWKASTYMGYQKHEHEILEWWHKSHSVLWGHRVNLA